jgi:hypothetical protein
VQARGFAFLSNPCRFARFATTLGSLRFAFLGFTRPAGSVRLAHTIGFARTAQLLLESLLLLAIELLLQIGRLTRALRRFGKRLRQRQLHRHDRQQPQGTGTPAHRGRHGLTVNWPRCERKVV